MECKRLRLPFQLTSFKSVGIFMIYGDLGDWRQLNIKTHHAPLRLQMHKQKKNERKRVRAKSWVLFVSFRRKYCNFVSTNITFTILLESIISYHRWWWNAVKKLHPWHSLPSRQIKRWLCTLAIKKLIAQVKFDDQQWFGITFGIGSRNSTRISYQRNAHRAFSLIYFHDLLVTD